MEDARRRAEEGEDAIHALERVENQEDLLEVGEARGALDNGEERVVEGVSRVDG